MANITLLFNLNRFFPRGLVNPEQAAAQNLGVTGPVALSMDAIENENPVWDSTPTENALEDGTDNTDHTRLLPFKVTLNCIISQTSTLLVPVRFGILTLSLNPVQDALTYLTTFFNNRQPGDFVSGLMTYQNVLIRHLSVDRNKTTGKALYFQMILQQVRIAQSQLVTVPESQFDPSVGASGASTVSTGLQAPTTASPDASTKGEAVLKSLSGFLGAQNLAGVL